MGDGLKCFVEGFLANFKRETPQQIISDHYTEKNPASQQPEDDGDGEDYGNMINDDISQQLNTLMGQSQLQNFLETDTHYLIREFRTKVSICKIHEPVTPPISEK